MIFRHIIFAAIFLSGFLFAQSSSEVFKKYRPMICKVQFFKNVSSQSQIGSYLKIKQNRTGLVVSADGLILVNSDVYPLSLDIMSRAGGSFYSGEPTEFKVILSDGKELAASFVGKDDQTQMAFLQIEDQLEEPLPHITFASGKDVAVGSPVFMLELLGENYQFQPVFTPAVINAVLESPRRKLLVKSEMSSLSAGGVVLSENGQAIGVTLRSDTNYGYMMDGGFEDYSRSLLEISPGEQIAPLVAAPPTLKQTKQKGKPWFGISMQALSKELKEFWAVPSEGGAIINRVFPSSPAANAGLESGDILIAFNGEPLKITEEKELDQLRETIANQKVDSKVELKIFRNKKPRKVTIKLTAAPKAIDLAEKVQLSEIGLEVRELTRDVLYNYHLPLDTKGVYVYQVDRASPVGLAGLSVGYIITEVNGQRVKDLEGFESLMQSLLKSDATNLMFNVRVRRQSLFIFADISK